MRFYTFLKVVAVLLGLALLGLVAFAYFADLPPRQVDIIEAIELDAD